MSVYDELKPLFSPKTIAVIGASEKEGSLGRAIMNNLLSISFQERYIP